MRRALPDDIPTLLDLMSGFYSEAGYKLDRAHAGAAFAAVLSDERLGYVWLIDEGADNDARTVGYIVLTLRFGMEYGGLMASIDDLFVVPRSRNKGLSTAAVVQVREFCRNIGIRAITVEVGYTNGPAQAVYRRAGLTETPDRQLLSLALAPPTHIV